MKIKYFKPFNLKTIKDLHITLNSNFAFLEKFPSRKKNTTLLPGIKLFFLVMFKSLRNKEISYPKLKNCDFLFISGSLNNHKVLSPLTGINGNVGFIGKGTPHQLPKFLAYFYSLPYLWKSLKIVNQAEGYEKKSYVAYFDSIWKTYGYWKMVHNMLDKIKPKIIVVSNDHVLLFRCILRISKEMNIKTVYVQHAGVAEHFPPLEFDYALLDGNVSYSKYLSGGKKCTSKIFLAGSPRFDAIYKIRNKRTDNETIGIAINQLDNFDMVKQAIYQIKKNSKTILIRLHPNIRGKEKRQYLELIKSNNLCVSDAYNEGVEQFLGRISLLIANNSFIHFEAILSGIQSINFKLSSGERDGYNFIQNGFIESAYNVEDIKRIYSQPINNLQEEHLKNSIGNYQELKEGKSTIHNYYDILNSLK